MKKIVKIIIIIIVLFVVIRLISNLFNTHYNIEYNLVFNKENYSINEEYKKENKSNNYYFIVKNKNNKYLFMYSSKHKSKKNIISIKKYKKDNLECIIPKTKNSNKNIYCILNKKQVSVSYLEYSNNSSFKYIKNKYKLNILNNTNKTTTKDYISIYKDNLYDYKYVVWFYKGIYVIDKNKVNKVKLLKKDKYDNNLSMLVGDYYATINTNLDRNSIEYKEILLYNLKKDRLEKIKLKDFLSINTYINGVYKDNLYITDNDSKKQYKINPVTKEVIEVGNKDILFKSLKNNKLINIRRNKNNIFSNNVINKKINKLYGNVVIYKSNYNYYFKTHDGEVYQIINNNYNNPILLFKFRDIEEYKVKDDSISFISDNTIYTYDNNYGLREVVINNEFRYNNKNIYDFIKK